MSATITERPHAYCFSENEVRYVFNIDDPLTEGCALEAEVYTYGATEDVADAVLLVGISNLVPNSDGSVYLYIEDYLKSVLAYTNPDVTTFFTHAPEQYRKFFIKFREVTTADADPAWTDDSANVSTVMLGGIESIKFSRNNFFLRLDDNKQWLTWQPSKRFVFADQRVFMSFLYMGAAITTYKLRVIATLMSGATVTDESFTQVFGDGNRLFHVQVGMDWMSLTLPAGDPVVSYTVAVLDESDNIICNAYTFYVHFSHRYDIMEFTYHNSLGGTDSVAVRGDWDWELERTTNEIEQLADYNNWNTTARKGNISYNNITKRDMYKGEVGFVNTKLQQEVMIEMFISRSVWHLIADDATDRWVQVVNMQKNAKLRSTRDKIWSFPIEWSYPFNDNVFTPKSMMLGNGSL